jgi:DNA mismatch repair protein MutS2
MAQRVGFPQRVLEQARASLSQDDVDTARLLADLEQKEAELEGRIAALDRKERDVTEQAEAQEREAAEFAKRQREAERDAHVQARDFLLRARKQLDEALRAEREAAGRARSELEASLRGHSQALRDLAGEPGAEDAEARLEPGDPVWITSLEREGRVVENRGSDVVVEMGGVKLQLAPAVLQKKGARPPKQRAAIVVAPELDARSEIDLRGLVADEARIELKKALDAAVQSGLAELRVIHGKGTGVLREAVSEQARGDRRVKSFRLGAAWEGGSGVTVLTLE